jgi:amino acid transporter
MQWLVTLPIEMMAASMTVNYWHGARSVNPSVWVTIFLLSTVTINFFRVRGYSEAEFIFSICQSHRHARLHLLRAHCRCWWWPDGSLHGAKTWDNPGAFAHGFKGVCSVFVTAAFSFGGTELVGLAAAESENSRISLPSAIKQLFWRVVRVSTPLVFLSIHILTTVTNC